MCCAARVVSSCDIGGGCVSTTHQQTLVARGGLGLARNTHYTHTHYTHTHTHTHTHTRPHWHTRPTTHTHTRHTRPHTRAPTPTGYSRGTPGVLPGCSQGTHECAAGTSAPHPTLLLPWVRPRPRRAARADLTPNRQRPSSAPQVRARSVVRQSIRGQRRGMGRAV